MNIEKSLVVKCRNKYRAQNILLKKTTAAQNAVALSNHKVRGLYFLAVVFVATIVTWSFSLVRVEVPSVLPVFSHIST